MSLRRLARLQALVIALSVGATGILPAGDAYRCLAMGRRMAPGHDCCASCELPQSAIGRPCCERVAGRALEARAASPIEQARIAPAPLAGVLVFATPSGAPHTIALAAPAGWPRGRPPGELLDRFSVVLRI
jgi:hypothetical protein